MHCAWYCIFIYEIQNTYSQNSWGAKREKIMVIILILELQFPSSKNDLGPWWTELCKKSKYAFGIPLWPLLLLCKVTAPLKQKLPDTAVATPGSGAGKRLPLQAWHGDGLRPVAAREGSIARGTRPHTGAASCRGQWHPNVPYPQGRTLCRRSRNIFFRIFVEISFASSFFFF